MVLSDRVVVIIGGGISGISCVEALIQDFDEDNPQYGYIILISDSHLVKKVTNYQSIGRHIEKFDIVETQIDQILGSDLPNNLTFSTIIAHVKSIDCRQKNIIYVKEGLTLQLKYDYICLCNGSKPRLLEHILDCPQNKEIDARTIVIRDTSTVENLREKLQGCHKIAIIGNGGISLELVNKVSNCNKVWIIRDDSIGSTFFDSEAGKFLLDAAKPTCYSSPNKSFSATLTSSEQGPALGPNWLTQSSPLVGGAKEDNLEIIYRDEIIGVHPVAGKFPLRLKTKQGKEIDCDLIALAVGVEPNYIEVENGDLQRSQTNGGILIDNQMRTSLSDVYAAGDVVSCDNWPENRLWFQMRLWTQARQMGHYAGRCIANHLLKQDPSIYFNFDCFTHCTTFFGYKLILLGCYNGQNWDQEHADQCEALVRINPAKDYVKVLIEFGRVVGAVLVGETSLEETIENLIHDQIDVSEMKEQLLDNTVDIEDYFD